MWEHRVQRAFAFSGQLLEDSIPSAMVILALFFAGLVLAWIFIRIQECITNRSSTKRWELENELYRERTTHRARAVIRVIFMLLAIASVLTGLVIGFYSQGYSLFSLAMGSGFLALLMTYGFGVSVQATFAYLLLSLTEKIEESWYLEVVGTGAQGRVTSINFLCVEMEYYNEQTNSWEEVQVPTHFFIQNIVRRIYAKERSQHAPLNPNASTPKKVGLKWV